MARSWSGSSGSDENDSPPNTREREVRSHRPVVATRMNYPGPQTAIANNENSPYTATSSGPSKSTHGQGVPQIRLSGADNEWTGVTHPAEHKYYFSGPPSPLYEDRNDPFDTPGGSSMNERSRLDSSDFRSQDPPRPRFSLSDEDETSPAPRSSQMAQDDITRHMRISQVVRKVNSGFEILRPGTLDKPPKSSDDANSGQNLDVAGSSPTKKLHKKNRDSLFLRESRFTEGA